MKSRSKMTKVFVWSLAPIALVLMMLSLRPAGAQATLALPDFDYNFDTLVNNQTIFGQDQWVNAVVGNVAVRTGPGVNQTQTAKGEGGSSGSGAIRPLDQPFYYTTKDTNVVWGVWGYAPSNCCNKNAIGGMLPVYFGPHQGGGGPPELRTILQRSSSPTQLYGDLLLHDHWYEYRVIVDFSIYGGLATLSYRDVTGGATAFTNDSVLQNVNLGLVPDASGRYGFFDVFIRNDGAGYVDNLHFDAPAPTGPCVPPPSGMVAWWPGDGSANDIRGSNNGTLVNGATFAPGMVGQAFSLDGADDYVQLSNSQYNPFPASGFTYDFWINPFDTPGGRGQTIISNHQATGSWWNGISLYSGSVELVLQNAATGQTFRWVTSSPLTPNAWQLIAVAYQNQGDLATDAVIYFNGTPQALETFSIGPAYSTDFTPGYSAADPLGFALGRLLEDTPRHYFRGLIDEGEFFNRALQAPEIQGIFNAGSAGKCKCVPPPPNMVAWWPGDGNANDIVGGNNGTLVSATIDPAGKVDQAFSFDGVNDFVEVPNSASLNPGGSFSIDAWVYPRTNGFQTIVGKWGDTGDQTNQRSYVLVNTGTGALNFGISDAAHQVDGAFHTLRTPDGALTLNAWNHVAVVYDQSTGTRKILVNGSQQATRTDPPITVLNSVARFGIGADLTSSTTSTALFDGLIDEVEFFNRALSASEVQAIFNAGSAGKCKCVPTPTGMVSTWPGDGNANDIVGGNNGTLVGATIDPAGIVHQAFSFDGVDDFVAVPNSASLNPGGSFSIDAWVYPRSNGIQTIVAKWGDTGDQPNQRSYGLINTGTGALNFGISDAAHQLDAAFHTLHTPDGALTLNAWNYVAAVYDQTTGTRKIFVNGGQQATRTDPPITVLNSVARFGIGAHLSSSTTSGAHFDGLIDEVSLYNRALTDAEIQSIYNAGSAGKCLPQACAPTIICPENIVVDNSNHPGECSAVVNYTVSASASCSSVTVGCAPPSSSVFPKGTTTVNCAATNSDGTADCSFTVTVIPPQLSTLSPARVWIGLKNSDDVGTKFDLLAEVLKNGAVVGTGQLNDVPGGSTGFNNAVLRAINLALSGPADICSGDTLGFRLSVRVAATSGHSSGTARLWYNDVAANSRLGAMIGGATNDYFFRDVFLLKTAAGPGPKRTIDVSVNRNVGGNPFKPFGTWSITF